jgi:hypothetical protein
MGYFRDFSYLQYSLRTISATKPEPSNRTVAAEHPLLENEGEVCLWMERLNAKGEPFLPCLSSVLGVGTADLRDSMLRLRSVLRFEDHSAAFFSWVYAALALRNLIQ